MYMDKIVSPLPPRQIKIEKTTVIDDKKEVLTDEVKKRVDLPVEKKVKKGLPLGGKLNWLGIVGGFVLVALIGFGIFKLLSKSGGVGKKEVTLSYWGLWESDSVLNGLIAKFEEENPNIKINYQMQNKENYRTRLEAKLEKGDVDAPDIFRFHSSWLPMIINRLEAVPAITSRNLKMDEDFFKVYKDDLKVSGNYMGIPLMYDGLVLYYNKELLDAANKNIPKTWWGLSNTASELTVRDENGNINVAGVAMGTTSNVDHWQDIIGLMIKQNGVDLTKMDETNWTKIKGILDFYRFFGQKQKWNVWNEKLPNSTQAFAAGKVVFYFGPSWRMHEINQLNPNLSYGTAKVPQLATIADTDPQKVEDGLTEGRLTNISWGSYWVEGVWNQSNKKEAAWKFLEFMASEKTLADFYSTASLTRDFGEIYPRKSMASKLADNKKLVTFVENADTSVSGWPSSRTWDDGLNEELSDYIEVALNATSINEEVKANLISGISRVVEVYKIIK